MLPPPPPACDLLSPMFPKPPLAQPGRPKASCVFSTHRRAAQNSAPLSCQVVLMSFLPRRRLLKPWRLAVFFPLPTPVVERLSDL